MGGGGCSLVDGAVAMKTAFLFPGQGAQHVGMGCDLYESFLPARDVFDRAETASGLPLKNLCFEGPEEELGRTDVSQPAIFTVSAALLAVMKEALPPEQFPVPQFTAGLSLGEYTALYAAGAMFLESTVRVVTRRGQLMQAAAAAVPSGMVSIIGIDEGRAQELCEQVAEGEILSCANFNCPGQVVLSGTIEACNRARERAKEFGAAAAVPLKVAGAFHTEIMRPAAEQLAKVLDRVEFEGLDVAVISNARARAYDGVGSICDNLVAQLTSPVRWAESMENLLEQGVERFYEIGPGHVLAGLMRRIQRKANVTCINSREAVDKLLQTQ